MVTEFTYLLFIINLVCMLLLIRANTAPTVYHISLYMSRCECVFFL